MAVIYPAVSSHAVGLKPVAASFPNNVLVQARGAAAVAGASVTSTTKQASAAGSVLVSSAGVTTTTRQTEGYGAAVVSVADIIGAGFSSGVSGAVSASVALSTPSKGVSATGVSAAVTAALTVPSKNLSATGVTTVTGVGTVTPPKFAPAVDNQVVVGNGTSIKPIQVDTTGLGVGVLVGTGELRFFKAMHVVGGQLTIPRGEAGSCIRLRPGTGRATASRSRSDRRSPGQGSRCLLKPSPSPG